MKNKDLLDCMLFVGTLLLIIDVTQQLSGGKKHPGYSLQNMPKTDFSCRDKILGGYYADSETQCQMFHICVKVAGVGVQDFRFLCPNGTAFDQEAQTCADFGDVDCEQATLYYGSSNFDLYRIGSGYDRKRTSLVAEEETTYHLQRAESNDLRRNKEPLAASKPYNFGSQFDVASVKPAKQYQPQKVSSTTTTTTTSQRPSTVNIKSSSTPQPFYNNRAAPLVLAQSKPYSSNNDEIFKGSHSSHFYSNRNSNDDDDDYKHRQTKNRPRQRGRAHYRGTPATTTSTTTYQPYLAQNYTTAAQTYSTTIAPSPSQFRFILSSTIRSTALPASVTNQPLTSTPLGPLQQQYHQPIYNNNFANFRTYATTTTAPFTTTQQSQQSTNHFRNNNFNQIYSTASTFSAPQRPVVSVPTPFNSHNNVNNVNNVNSNNNYNNQFSNNNNQKIIFNANASLAAGKQQTVKTFDNHNPINNYQTSSPFANHQPYFNQKQIFPSTNYNTNNNASTRLAPAASNQLNFNQQQNIQSNRNQRTNNNHERVPTTITPHKITTTQSTASRSTYRPSFHQQDFINQYNVEQQRLSQQKQQQQQSSQIERNPQNNRNAQQISLEQKRLQLHYDINDYLTSTNKYMTDHKYSPTSEQYRSVQTFSHPNADYSTKQTSKNTIEAYTQKYIQPKASQSQSPYTFPTSTVSNKPNFNQFNQYQTQQDRPAPSHAPKQQPQSTFTAPINVQNTYSTLVPKENYAPTTFKPSYYFNVAKQINDNLSTPTKQQPHVSTTSTTVRPNPINYSQQPFKQFNYNQPQQKQFIALIPKSVNVSGVDEHDGQYHPELYEKDFARYKIKNRKKQQQQKQIHFNIQSNQNARSYVPNINQEAQKSLFSSSNEDEILNTAHSQNIAATGNELWASNSKKPINAKQTSTKQPNTIVSKAPTIPTNATNIKKTASAEDVSYDYAYYDSANDAAHEYSELEVVDFGKTKKP